MNIFDILFLAIALSMDAMAVGMTNGMTDSKMPVKRVLTVGAFFGIFQALMPLGGYFLTKLVAGAFLEEFEKASSWVSFILLAFLGGKMVFDFVKELKAKKTENAEVVEESASLTTGKLFLQAIATSIDAFAIGVTLQMAQLSPAGLFPPVGWSVCMIGCVTFLLSVLAVYIGKLIGNKLADKAELVGGIVLICIGIKILIEGL